MSLFGEPSSVTAHGAQIPLIGLGTWELRGSDCAEAVEHALRLGYRHIDTAEIYENEREVGRGLRASGVDRSDIFVTTKIWPNHFVPRELESAARECLVRLRLSEVDLLLLHWPNPHVPLADTIGALCKVKRDGLARHIGLSNFTVAIFEEASRTSNEPLICDQIEYHPFLDQSKVTAACHRHGVAIVAHTPLARGQVLRNGLLSRIGAAHKKTVAQISLRFLVQQHIAVIPRTKTRERLIENAAIFDFALEEREMGAIAELAHPGGRIVDWVYSDRIKWD